MIPSYAPAVVGATVEAVDTPSLLVDLDAFDANLQRMQDFADTSGMRLRPHAKTHKCSVIARQQVRAGAVGVCCQKVSEAEAMVLGGIDNVLITNQVVGDSKLDRLASLARLATIGVCVDDKFHVDALAAVCRRYPVSIKVLVEIDVGSGRCGVEPGEAAVLLVRQVADSPGLEFSGLQAYFGAAQHLRSHEERAAAIREAVEKARATRDLLQEHGIACPVISGAGTGTFALEAASGVYNELQPGSYLFMDADYARNRDADGGAVSGFAHSLFVLTTVMSRARAGQVVVDAGLKALSVDAGMPWLVERSLGRYERATDEHGIIRVGEDRESELPLGAKIRLIPGHCDPTINLYDYLVGIRGGRVETIWPVSARGATR